MLICALRVGPRSYCIFSILVAIVFALGVMSIIQMRYLRQTETDIERTMMPSVRQAGKITIATTMEYIETDPHQMRYVLEERADKVPRSLIARVDYSARQHQEQRLDPPKPPLSLPFQQPRSISGPSTLEAFDQLTEWISNGARPPTAVVRRG